MFLIRLTQAILALVMEIRAIAKVLRLRQPGVVFLKLVSEGKNGMLKFTLVLPPAGASDVVSRSLSVQVGTAEPQSFDLAGDALESAEFEGNDNDAVVGTLVDIDDAGNKSEPRSFEFVLTDTIAPPQPGELGLRVNSEV